jgi:hypothetical protein
MAHTICVTAAPVRLMISATSVQQKYEDAAERFAKASRAIRGEDNPGLGNAVRLAAGIGVGIGLGLLFAPARGQDTRRAIAGSVQQFGDKVRKRVSPTVLALPLVS